MKNRNTCHLQEVEEVKKMTGMRVRTDAGIEQQVDGERRKIIGLNMITLQPYPANRKQAINVVTGKGLLMIIGKLKAGRTGTVIQDPIQGLNLLAMVHGNHHISRSHRHDKLGFTRRIQTFFDLSLDDGMRVLLALESMDGLRGFLHLATYHQTCCMVVIIKARHLQVQ